MPRRQARLALGFTPGVGPGAGGFSPFSDTFARADGDLGNGWTYAAGKWTIASNAAIGTPDDAGELLTNPGFEGVYVAGIAPGYTAQGTPTTLAEEGAIIHGGAAAQKMIADAANEGVKAAIAGTTVIGQILHVGAYLYPANANMSLFRAGNDVEARAFTTPPGVFNQWHHVHGTLRMEGVGGTYGMIYRMSSAGTGYVDDASLKLLTMADVYALRPGVANVSLKATMTFEQYEYAGIALRMDSLSNPKTGLVVYHNGTQVVIEKLTGGLWAKVGTNATVTYVAGAALEVDANGTTITVRYNNVQVREETIADYATQTVVGLVATDPSVAFGYFEAVAYG